MPGPQMVAAIPIMQGFRAKYMSVPIVWGGYFPSLYTDATLNANYVDFVVKGQGEETFAELLCALRGDRKFGHISGLSFKDVFGLHVHNADASAARSPNDFLYPALSQAGHRWRSICCRRFWGRRTAGPSASIGCPLPVPVLRRSADFSTAARKTGGCGAHGCGSRAPAARLRDRCGAVLRQQFLPA